jgi:hypothetical protein
MTHQGSEESGMYSLHPALTEAHARARVNELQRQARQASGHRRGRRLHPWHRSMRTTAGWFLVSLGLRLAVSPPRPLTPVAR